jgi:hypothetical protein
VKPRDGQGLLGEIDAGYQRAARSHCLGEYPAAASDVEHAARFQTGRPVDVGEPQRIDLVQRPELGVGIPPAVRKLAELVQLAGVGVLHQDPGFRIRDSGFGLADSTESWPLDPES